MNIKANILIASFLTFMSGMVYSQDTSLLDRLYEDFSSNLVTLDISYVLEISSTDMLGEGTVEFQDNAYHLSGNGIEVYCDGKDVWLIDPAAKEVYIEPVSEGMDAYIQNPALLFTGLKENFEVVNVKEGGHIREPGVKDIVYDLMPKVSCGIEECSIQLKKDGTLYYGTFVLSDGQADIIRVKVNSIKKSDRKDISSFRPTRSFDSSWMVTDLR